MVLVGVLLLPVLVARVARLELAAAHPRFPANVCSFLSVYFAFVSFLFSSRLSSSLHSQWVAAEIASKDPPSVRLSLSLSLCVCGCKWLCQIVAVGRSRHSAGTSNACVFSTFSIFFLPSKLRTHAFWMQKMKKTNVLFLHWPLFWSIEFHRKPFALRRSGQLVPVVCYLVTNFSAQLRRSSKVASLRW